MHRYRPLVFAGVVSLCVAGFALAAIASALPHYTTLADILNAIAIALLVADIALVLVADWRGLVTLNGHINWAAMSSAKRFSLGCLACICSPLLLAVYLVQVARHTPPPPSEVPSEVRQYMRDGDLSALKRRVAESLTQRP